MALTAHFLNVGHGDCTIIEHPSGRITMIDINNSKSLPEADVDALAEYLGITTKAFRERIGIGAQLLFKMAAPPAGFDTWDEYYRSFLVDPTDWYLERFGIARSVWRYIQTHPDMDHMSGLHRMFVQEGVPLSHMWDTPHTRDRDEFDSTRYNPDDWATYCAMRSGELSGIPQGKVLHLNRGDSANFWADDNIDILGPTIDVADNAVATDNWNNLSFVLRVTHAGRSIILPGDAEKPAWDKITSLSAEGELACDILKASHHGRESGYVEDAVDMMDPEFVVCSVGKKPATDASDEYRDNHGAKVLSTRYHGTITVVIDDDGSVAITDRNGEEIGSVPAYQWSYT